MKGNKRKLFVGVSDHSEPSEVVFNSETSDENNLALALTIAKNIPAYLLNTNKDSETFGMPDSNDQCGIYFEIVRGTSIKKFNIDTQPELVREDIKTFAELLLKTFSQMKNINYK